MKKSQNKIYKKTVVDDILQKFSDVGKIQLCLEKLPNM